MKKLLRIFSLLLFVAFLPSCSHKDVNPTDDASNYQKAIDAKFILLGWDKAGYSKFNGSLPIKTAGSTGYVQYYAIGTGKGAIYYFPGKGAFAVNELEMNTYDANGQDKWAMVVSDPIGTIPGGCGYNEFELVIDKSEAIITCNIVLYGPIYAKYKELKRWDGPLGVPTAGIMDTPQKAVDGGTFGSFKNGTIWNTPKTKTTALWGKVLKLYAAVDYERSWLGLPTESCDPNKKDDNQKVAFVKGSIEIGNNGTCGNYYDSSGLSVLQNGNKSSSCPPCY